MFVNNFSYTNLSNLLVFHYPLYLMNTKIIFLIYLIFVEDKKHNKTLFIISMYWYYNERNMFLFIIKSEFKEMKEDRVIADNVVLIWLESTFRL